MTLICKRHQGMHRSMQFESGEHGGYLKVLRVQFVQRCVFDTSVHVTINPAGGINVVPLMKCVEFMFLTGFLHKLHSQR